MSYDPPRFSQGDHVKVRLEDGTLEEGFVEMAVPVRNEKGCFVRWDYRVGLLSSDVFEKFTSTNIEALTVKNQTYMKRV